MMTRPSVLCPIDFSDASRGALRYAAAIAEHFHAEAQDRRAAEAAQRRVQARAVTATREDADVLGHARKLARSGPRGPA